MRPSSILLLLGAVFLTGFSIGWGAEHPWPQFRGPNGNGVANADDLPLKWSESENVSWKTELPGKAWSSPVVTADGVAWMTTAVESVPDQSEREKLLTEAGDDPKKFKQRQIATRIQLKALEVDLKTGKLLREIDLFEIDGPDSIHSLNSYASPTPVIEGDRLFCHFGTFGTVCIDTSSGSIVWNVQFELEHSVGPGSSPHLHGDLLVLICDGVDHQFVVALNKQTGETAWKTDRPEMRAPEGQQKKAFSTPISIQDRKGRDQLVCMGSQWLVSYEPQTGKELWRLDHGKGFSIVARPVYEEALGLIYISTGFGKPELWAVRPDGDGDITGSDLVAWKEPKRIPAKPSPLIVDGRIYVISDGGIATCFNGSTGEALWTERIEGNYSASPLFADGKIFFCSHEGKITVIDSGPEFQVLAENQLDGQLMASPVALDGSLLIRSDTAIYRISGVGS